MKARQSIFLTNFSRQLLRAARALIIFGALVGSGILPGSVGSALAKDGLPVSRDTQLEAASGTITIRKEVTPEGGPSFGFTSDIPDNSTFTLSDGDSITFLEVPLGSYTITEDDPGPLYVLSGLSCSYGASLVSLDLDNRSLTVDLADGDTVDCTYYNDKQAGTITIRKEVTPEGGPSFGFTSDIPDNSAFALNDGDSITFLEVPLGSYTITEDDPGPLYVLSGLSCSYGASLVSLDLDNRSLTVDLADGDTVDCTYYNDKQAGTITIRKEVTPEGGPSFGFTSDIPDNSTFALNDGDSITFLEVPLGSYTITEDDPGPLYVLSGLSCSYGASSVNLDLDNRSLGIDLADGDTVDCTYYNDKQAGTITIGKEVTPEGGPGFGFTSDIPDNSTFALNDGDSITFLEVPVGSYTITEDDPGPLYVLDGLSCSYGASSVNLDLDNRSLGIELADGDTVDCTYYNDKRAGTITIGKEVTPGGGPGFGFTSDIPDNSTFALNDGDSITFLEVPVGSYTITEDDPGPLYVLDGLSCSYGASSVNLDLENRSLGIDLADGDTVDCTYFNKLQGPLVDADIQAQDVQYSDLIQPVTITADYGGDDTLSAATSWSSDGISFSDGLPAGLTLGAPSCTTDSGVQSCNWTIEGAMREAAGTYTIRTTVSDNHGNSAEVDVVITVSQEDAAVGFSSDSPVAIPVTSPGSDSSEAFTLKVDVQEAAESGASGAPGDINLVDVTLTLTPIVGGSPHTVTCSEPNPAAAYDYNAVLTAHCDFSGLAVDAYIATVTVTGGYYAGADEDIVVVYDPSLGFTTGGGWFYWPGTTERTTFGFNMKHNKKGTNLKGSLILIRHAPDGSRYRLKSNSLGALTLDEAADAGTGDTYGWAFFSGKTTYLAPGMKGAEGNFEFSIYVEDRTEPGAGMDRFWMEVLNKDDQVVMDLSMPQNAPDNTVTISGGNIVVPHVRGSGK